MPGQAQDADDQVPERGHDVRSVPVGAVEASSPKVTSRMFSRGGARLAELDLRVSAGQQLVVMKVTGCNRCGATTVRRVVSACCRGLVEPGHQLAVGGAGSGEF